MANALTPVEFHGVSLFVTTINGVPHVALRPICESVGLDWSAQLVRIKKHPVLSKGMVVTTTPSAGGDQQMVMLPLDKLDGWLFGVSVRRVKPELRERLTQYQAECFDVLAQHFGAAVKPPVSDLVPSLVNRRWLVSFDHNGKECVQSIPHDAMLVTWDEIVHLVSDHSLMLTNAQLANLAKAATDRIANRMASRDMQKTTA